MFCSQCGTKVSADSAFCSECGTSLAATTVAPAQPAGVAPAAPATPKYAAPAQTPAYGAPQQVGGVAWAPGMLGFNCGRCGRPAMPDRRFCTYCTGLIADPASGRMAGLFQRFVANVIDTALGWVALVVLIVVASGAGDAGPILALVLAIGWIVLWVVLMNQGTTLGKLLLGLRVQRTDGSNPGFWTMLLREWIGKFISYVFFGLGYWWAIWDKDRQTWHDKIAGTVVVAR